MADGVSRHAIVDRIIISRSKAEPILSELNTLGINQGSLFPDLEGLGGHISWEWNFLSQSEAARTNATSPRRAQYPSARFTAPRMRKLHSSGSSSASEE